MNETMKIKTQDSLYNYLTIFRSFGNCGIDGNYYGYWFKTTSEPELYLYIGNENIELFDNGSSKLISRCNYRDLLKGYEPLYLLLV